MSISSEQLRRYADVICAWQAGNTSVEIAAAFSIPENVIQAWIINFLELDRGYSCLS